MEKIMNFLDEHAEITNVTSLLISTAVAVVAVLILLWVVKKVFRKLKPKQNKLNVRFVENIIRFIIIFLALQWVIMSNDLTRSFGTTLFQGTAVITAIAGFAAQPVLSDLICGMMLSATQPFDMGDRIELEDGTAGIVKDITLRHVTLQTIDTIKVIVPNHNLNSMKLTNLSYRAALRSVHFRFSVAYSADPEEAAKVIRKAILESPYSEPGKPTDKGMEYGPVYFIAYEASSLTMATTVYYKPTNPTEVVKNDINIRVKKALNKNNIEIPYSYMNVVLSEKDTPESGVL